MTDEDQGLGPDEPTFEADGFEDEVKTSLGFGGKKVEGRLKIGDERYYLMKVEIVSDGRSRKKDDDGELTFKAGGSTTILAELAPGDATKIAAQYG